MSRNSIQPRDSTGDGFHSFIAPRTKLSFDLNDAHENSWNRFFLSFSSRGDRISRTTEFFLRLCYIPSLNGKGTRAPATLPPVSHTRRKKKTSGRSTRRPISLRQRSRATSNVRSRFLFHSFLPRSLTLLPRVSSSSLPFLSSPRQLVHTGQIARIRLHRTVK